MTLVSENENHIGVNDTEIENDTSENDIGE